MKTKLPLLSDLFVFIVGVLLIVLHGRELILETIIMIVGIMMIVPSCVALVAVFAKKFPGNLNIISALPILGGLALGVALVAVPEFFIGVLAYTFAVIIMLGAIYKLWLLFSVGRYVPFHWSVYLIPVALLVCGIVILTTSVREIASTLVLISGISFVAYSVNSLVEYIFYRQYLKQHPDMDASPTRIIEIGNDK